MTTKRILFFFITYLIIRIPVFATEGMWIPSLLKALNEDDMYSMGLEIPVEAIYSINEGSLKDAIVHFNGGCTAELISAEGLLLTNHHCGYSQIQFHSSLENDYLKNGFWAMERSEELPNEDLFARFVVRMEDVSEEVWGAINSAEPDNQAQAAAERIEKIKKEWAKNTGLDAEVKPFNFGNSYFLILTKTYFDVRLVGAPPSSIGKFGGDTDNWVWPRHTGDFSLFRIYADENNEPAQYAESNRPYKPAKHLPVSLNGVKEGDFCMVFGFPGYTEQFLIADAVEHVVEELNPDRIAMREAALSVVNAAMESSDELRIKYAAKQSRIANAWKKWIGQNQGLKEVGALQIKREFEEDYRSRATKSGKDEYIQSLQRLEDLQSEYEPYLMSRAYFIEYFYYGQQLLRFTSGFKGLVDDFEKLEASGSLEETLNELRAYVRKHFKDYDGQVDKKLFLMHTPMFLDGIKSEVPSEELSQKLLGAKNGMDDFADKLYEKSIFVDSTALLDQLDGFNSKTIKKWKKDPAMELTNMAFDWYFKNIRGEYSRLNSEMDTEMATYVRGIAELFPNKTMWFDANSTLRLTYGKVEGSAPWDGMEYKYYTTASGILQKYRPGHKDFDLPPDLVELFRKGDFGIYADDQKELRICFTGSNHTTGGNSGSPAINGKGELVGLNFDRSWESTMSDIMFDASRCRNIMVDVRYILWVIDKYAGATHLVNEMSLVRGEKEKPELEGSVSPESK